MTYARHLSLRTRLTVFLLASIAAQPAAKRALTSREFPRCLTAASFDRKGQGHHSDRPALLYRHAINDKHYNHAYYHLK